MQHGTTSELIKESENWKTKLQLLENEKMRAKLRLSDILSSDFSELRQDLYKDIQARFVKLDAEIAMLRHEVREHIYQLNQPSQPRHMSPQKLGQLHKNLEVKLILLQSNVERTSASVDACMVPVEK